MTQQTPPPSSVVQFNKTVGPIPYGLAAFAHLGSLKNVKFAVSPTASHVSLRVSGSVLSSEGAIMRYFARSQPSVADKFYPEDRNHLIAHQIDLWLAECFDSSPAQVSNLITRVDNALKNANLAAPVSLLTGFDGISIADLAVWSVVKSQEKQSSAPLVDYKKHPAFQSWFNHVELSEACKHAIKDIEQALLEIPAVAATEKIVSKKAPKEKKPTTAKLENPLPPIPSDLTQQQSSQQPTPAFDITEYLKTNPVDPLQLFRNDIAVQLNKLTGVPIADIEATIETAKPAKVQTDASHFIIPVPRLKMKGNPVQVAQELSAKIQSTALLESSSANGPFIYFRINTDALRDILVPWIHQANVKYGCNNSGNGKNVVVEFSSPNIAKPFHAGHLRSTIIGNFMRNACNANGFNTISINYLGDWGKQYGLLAVGYEKYGNEEALLENPIKHLFDVYVKISQDQANDPSVDTQAFAYFKRMEEGDEEALSLWRRFRNLSIEKYRQIYARLNVEFDVYSGESMYSDKMKVALADLKQRKVLTESAVLHKGVLVKAFEKYGDQSQLNENGSAHILDIYTKFLKESDESDFTAANQLFEQISSDELFGKETMKPFTKVRGLELGKPNDANARFNIAPTERDSNPEIKSALEYLQSKDSLEFIADLSQYKLPPARVQRADGASLYITRDIAAAIDRHEEYNFDHMYYVVGAAQGHHFDQFFKILEMAKYDWQKNLTHIGFGLVRGMSTRKGNVVFLEDILNEAQSTMHRVMKENENKYAQISDPEAVADIIGLSAVIVQDMQARRIKDYDFSWDRMMSFEGDTGPYLQYSHTRICSIERKFLEQLGMESELKSLPPIQFTSETLKHINQPVAADILFVLAQYPGVVAQLPHRNFESSILVTYLMSLCHKVSSLLEQVYVLGQEREVAEGRFWMYWATKTTLANGMRLLGLKPLERM